ncbi:MAG: cysteine desulfurase [Bacteroidetes bacterium]|nr:cysteine desulfurase [Bacteroidota bacterium]
MSPLHVGHIRSQIPILSREIKGKPLVYLDNAATTQKPQCVVDALCHYYLQANANVHRGIHTLSEEATHAMEQSRHFLADYLGALPEEIIFTKGTTEAINLVASSLAKGKWFRPGGQILLSYLEHHANIVPWQMVAEQHGLEIKVIPVTDQGELDLAACRALISPNTQMVALGHTSNALGTVNPVREIVAWAREVGALSLVDGAQAMGHTRVNMTQLGADFFAFSAHKAFGPTGVGVLYGRANLLDRMPPYQGGGEMITEVRFEKTTYNTLPFKFEAGTPHISGNIVAAEAVKWFTAHAPEAVAQHEQQLLQRATHRLEAIDGLRIIGQAKHKAPVVSFVVEGVHHHDLAIMLDIEGIAVRTGHHCTQPLMERFGITGTTRASFSLYNTLDEVDFFADMLKRAINKLR